MERQIEIASCEAILPNGGRFTGRHDEFPPVDVRKLQAGITIQIEWVPKIGGISRIELDGRIDEIFIRRPFVAKEHVRLLTQIRKWRHDGLAVESFGETNDEENEPGIDRAIREYVETHPDVVAEDDLRIREQFLDHIRDVAHSERQEYEREIALVRTDERRASLFLLIAIGLGLVLFAAGTFLLFLHKVTFGTVSELCALLSGGATALLRLNLNGLKVKRASIENRQRDSRDTALMIQAAMAHSENRKRSSEISRVTQLLMARVTQTPLQADEQAQAGFRQRPKRKRRRPPKNEPANTSSG